MRSRQKQLWFGVVAALLVLGSTGASAGAGSDAEFSAAELRQLARGELVQRPLQQERGGRSMLGGTSWQVIDAPPQVLWQALLDTRHYPRMLPQVSEARLVRDNGSARTIFVRHGGTLLDTSYYLDVKLRSDRMGITFRVDEKRAKGIRSASGFYALKPYGHKTLLVYGVMADIGTGLFPMFLRSTVHQWMMKVPWMVKRFVEGSGRYIYKR